MSEDVLDYMSDNIIESTSEDIRPGLVQSRTEMRQNELAKKKEISDQLNRVKCKSRKEIEKETLVMGLQNPINASNKGYAMLERMGFKPGSTLGKSESGLKEPIPLPINRNFREGLGVKAALQEMRIEKKKQRVEQKKNGPSVQDFRGRMSEQVREREAGIDLFKSQKSCHSLDTAAGLTEPMEEWFWPLYSFDKTEEDEENDNEIDDQLTVQDKLEMLTYYLRKTYFYCVWCGVNYDDEKDMQKECPGLTRDDH